MKTKEELAAIKNEVEALNKKLEELSDDELMQVTGGTTILHNMPKKQDDEKYVMGFKTPDDEKQYDIHIYKNDL